MEAGNGQHLSLDSEGGAQATTPKTRYLTTTISIGVAAFASDDTINQMLEGASGFNLIGLAIGAASRSRALAICFGVYGASKSVYNNYLSRGHDVVFPARFSHMAIRIRVARGRLKKSSTSVATFSKINPQYPQNAIALNFTV